MSNQMSPMQLIQMVKETKDPSAIVMRLMEDRVSDNPFYANILSLAKNNQTQDIENIVRNIFKEKGYDYDKEFNAFKQMF